MVFEESPSTDTNERIRFDNVGVNKLFSLCSASSDDIVNVTRLGRLTTNKSRPLNWLYATSATPIVSYQVFWQSNESLFHPYQTSLSSKIAPRQNAALLRMSTLITTIELTPENRILVHYVNSLPRIVTIGSKN